MYLEYFARLPETAALRSCGDARALLARLRDEAQEPDRFDLRLLHLTNDGRPHHAPASIRIGARRHSLVISAVGSDAVTLVQTNALKIGALLTRHFRADTQQKFVQGECNVEVAPMIRSYRVPSLVLVRRNFTRQDNGISYRTILDENRLEHPMPRERIVKVITEGIERQAGICLLDLPPFLLGDIRVHRLAPVLVKPKVYFLVGEVSFRAAAALRGPWYAGYLQSRGFGRIFADAAADATPRSS